MKKQATAVWNGTIKEGKGHLSSQSGVLKQTPYTFVSRFENGTGTNPEELMAAAHAGCFTMKLSADLTTAGYQPEELTTTSTITLDNGVITKSDLVLTAKITGITEEEFQKMAKSAEETCPVSNALKLEITLNATLV
ncbi:MULTISPECIES: OsmC family peroxiredoxin [Sinomicrobium]|uniref:Osmotically inducible protein OsmC n=1 Tax=Sinomicrobium oceani TaxID=1150368 RepID=A0A1K1Q700_9FLAO|nr:MULTISPECIES: OsmC family peroxiredoxin [Sinomicrobium]RAV29010.1 OsmC family peroxiredoxin [Sinomicrobium sp. N-1-3-6]SFW55497.1 osmotically inducible protein OsmC [Sinomicrobium oceani]